MHLALARVRVQVLFRVSGLAAATAAPPPLQRWLAAIMRTLSQAQLAWAWAWEARRATAAARLTGRRAELGRGIMTMTTWTAQARVLGLAQAQEGGAPLQAAAAQGLAQAQAQ